jgi:hypothetical protein
MNDLPFDRLGPFPILQFAAAVVVLAMLAFAMWRGARNRSGRSSDGIVGEQRYYFDGPIGEALKLMRDTRNIMNEVKEHVEPLGEQLRLHTKELGEIKGHVEDLKTIKSRRR